MVLLLGVTALGGLLIGVFLSSREVISFNGEVSAGNIFQSCATIGSAFIVTLFLQKTTNDRRKQKDLLLQQYELLLALLGQFEDMHTSSELARVNSLLKKISMKSEFIARCMKECGAKEDLLRLSDFSGLIKDLRLKSTDTPKSRLEEYAEQKGCPAYVKEGIITWATERRKEIDMTLEHFKSAVFRAQLKLNQS
jgi:hypothetical protein